MKAPLPAPTSAAPAGTLPLTAVQAGTQAKLLLTKKELSVALPMSVRTIEKLVSTGVLPALKITPRMVRFELPACMAALRQFQTATLNRKK